MTNDDYEEYNYLLCKIIENQKQEIERQEKSLVIFDNQNAELQEENERLKEKNDTLTFHLNNYERIKNNYGLRIDKAIEEINYMISNADITEISGIKLKQILRGIDNE